MNRDHIALIQFVLEKASSEPVQRRIAVYRGLAHLCGDADETNTLESLARELEVAESRCREFTFQFSQKHQPGRFTPGLIEPKELK